MCFQYVARMLQKTTKWWRNWASDTLLLCWQCPGNKVHKVIETSWSRHSSQFRTNKIELNWVSLGRWKVFFLLMIAYFYSLSIFFFNVKKLNRSTIFFPENGGVLDVIIIQNVFPILTNVDRWQKFLSLVKSGKDFVPICSR